MFRHLMSNAVTFTSVMVISMLNAEQSIKFCKFHLWSGSWNLQKNLPIRPTRCRLERIICILEDYNFWDPWFPIIFFVTVVVVVMLPLVGNHCQRNYILNNPPFAGVISFHNSSKKSHSHHLIQYIDHVQFFIGKVTNGINSPAWGFSGEVGSGSVSTHCKISYRSCKRLIFRVLIAFMPYLVPFKAKNRSKKSPGKASENSFLLQNLCEYF